MKRGPGRTPTVILVIIVVFLSLIGAVAIFLNSDAYLNSDLNPDLDFEHYPKEYMALFADSNQRDLKLHYTINSRHKNPITEFYYNDNKYSIEVFKLSTKQNLELKERIILNNTESQQSDFVHYNGFFDGLYPVFYKSRAKPTARIYLNYQGAEFSSIVQNDTVSCYFLKMKNFSVKYDDQDTSAIFAKNVRNHREVQLPLLPVSIMLMQKNKSVYFLIMSVNDIHTLMKPDLLYNLVSDK